MGSKVSENCLAGQACIAVPPYPHLTLLYVFLPFHAKKQMILTLQFCRIYGDQMTSIPGFIALGKKWFIKVLFSLQETEFVVCHFFSWDYRPL